MAFQADPSSAVSEERLDEREPSKWLGKDNRNSFGRSSTDWSVANDLSEVTAFMTLSANENMTNIENKENVVTIVGRNRSQF